MATGYVSLLPGAAVLPDGSTGNLAPGLRRVKGTEADPKKHYLVLDFQETTAEYASWQFRLPGNYASAGSLVILWTATSITAGHEVVWAARVAAVTAADVDTPAEHAGAAAATVTTGVNTTEAGRLISSSITLTMDSAAGGDFINVMLYRDAAAAADDATGDASVLACEFQYTI